MGLSAKEKRAAENDARVAAAEEAQIERRATRKISHKPDGGERSVQELRDLVSSHAPLTTTA